MKLDGQLLMGSDAPASWYKNPRVQCAGRVTTPEDAERIFNALSEGGTVTMALGDILGAPLRHLRRSFRYAWMVNCEKAM